MKDIYTEGGYVLESDKPFVPVGLIHRSECPPFILNRSNKKTHELDPRIDSGATKKSWTSYKHVST